LAAGPTTHAKMEMRTFPVLAGAGAHDVYPAPDGAVWFTAQSAGKLRRDRQPMPRSRHVITVNEPRGSAQGRGARAANPV